MAWVLEFRQSQTVMSDDPQRSILFWCFEQGINCGYIQVSSGQNLSALHVAGQDDKIRALIRSRSMYLESHPVFNDQRTEGMLWSRVQNIVQFAPRVLNSKSCYYNSKLGDLAKRIVKTSFKRSIPWNCIYDGTRIELIYTNDAGIHVLFREGAWPGSRLQTFTPGTFANALRGFRIYPFDIPLKDLRLDYRQDVYIVGGDQLPSEHQFNRYVKTPYLTEVLEPDCVYQLPPNFALLLNNLGSADVSGCLLNLLAHYLQTFKKPQLIPYMTGGQGTGKGTLAEILGIILGDYVVKTTKNILENFDGWKANSAVVLLDEIKGETEGMKRKIEQILLPLINEQQSVRRMFKEAVTFTTNNLILIANNASTAENVFRMAADDRRYLVVSGGENFNLTKTGWWDRAALFAEISDIARHLRTRPVDATKLNVIPMTPDRQRLIGESIPQSAKQIQTYLNTYTADGRVAPELLSLTQMYNDLRHMYGRNILVGRPQDVKGQMEQYLGLDDARYWRKPNNKTHFVYSLYHQEQLESMPEDVA